MPSFDVVSKVDMHELTNAIDQCNREVTTRFDLKGTSAKVENTEYAMTIFADDDFQVKQVLEILYGKLAKRGIDVSCLDLSNAVAIGKGMKRDLVARHGIDKDSGRKIIKLIKDSKFKLQAQMQDEQVRVTGKKRDELQSAISLLKDAEIGLPLQFVNFRD